MKKRANGLYQKQITVTENGEKKQKCFYGKTIAEINQKILDYKGEDSKVAAISNDFEMWLDRWWEYHQAHIRYNTISSYLKPIEDVREYFRNRQIAEIKPSEIRRFIVFLEHKKFARQTINLRYIVLCKTFDYAIECDLDIANAARAVKLPSGLRKTKRENLTNEEIKIVQESGDLFANFLLYTGCRKNEALAVQWPDIDFKKRIIMINKAIVWENNKPVISETKTTSGIRAVPLLEPLERLLLPAREKCGFIFNTNGGILEKKQVRTMWDRYIEQIGIRITPHQFRHAFITIMYYAGIDTKTAQAIAGHSKVDTILNIYTHLDKNSQDSARVKINEFLKI